MVSPLSSLIYLILAQQALSSLIHKEVQREVLQPICKQHKDLDSSHLMFADDVLILVKATSEAAEALKDIKELYEQEAGQSTSVEKSSIILNHVPLEMRRAIRAGLSSHFHSYHPPWPSFVPRCAYQGDVFALG